MAAAARPSTLGLAVLSVLADRPMHPYEIAAVLRERRKEESIKLRYGSLYSAVETLARQGLITADGPSREGRRPERTVYAVTAAGRTAFHDGLVALLGTREREYGRFEAGLSLMTGLPPGEALALLRERLTTLEREGAEVAALLDEAHDHGVPALYLVETTYREALRRAEEDVVRDLVEGLAGARLRAPGWND